MILVVDVGNTNITVGLFNGRVMENSFRMTTAISRTSDEYGMMFGDWLSIKGFDISDVSACIISSVVPNTTVAVSLQ